MAMSVIATLVCIAAMGWWPVAVVEWYTEPYTLRENYVRKRKTAIFVIWLGWIFLVFMILLAWL